VNQVVQVAQEALGPKWLISNHLRPSSLVWSAKDTLLRDVEIPFLGLEALSGGCIKVTKGAWRGPKWQAFVVSQVVLLGETW
jgi:hypothetical protein